MANSYTDARREAIDQYRPFVKRVEECFCKNVRACREKKGLSQYDLAERLGTSQTWVNNVELGKKAVGMKTLIKFAMCLKVEADELISPKLPFGHPSPVDLSKSSGARSRKGRRRVA